jgi:hypothetical protein
MHLEAFKKWGRTPTIKRRWTAKGSLLPGDSYQVASYLRAGLLSSSPSWRIPEKNAGDLILTGKMINII